MQKAQAGIVRCHSKKETTGFLNEVRQWSGCQLMNTLLLSDSFEKKFLSSPNGSRSPSLPLCIISAARWREAEPLQQLDALVQGLAAGKDPALVSARGESTTAECNSTN